MKKSSGHTVNLIDPPPGEPMTCVLCGRAAVAPADGWRAVQIDRGEGAWYACPAEFPEEETGYEPFTGAYVRFFVRVVEKAEC